MPTRYYFRKEVYHEGLNKYRVVKAANYRELQQKVKALNAQWDAQWSRIVEREERKKNEQDSESYAKELTQHAEEIQKGLDQILLKSLCPKDLNLDEYKDFSEFPEPQPEIFKLKEVSHQPQRSDKKYNPKISLFAKLSKKKVLEMEEICQKEFELDLEKWREEKIRIDEENNQTRQQYQDILNEWETRKKNFEQTQMIENSKIDSLFSLYKLGDTESVEQYFKMVLETIELPFNYDRIVELEYDQKSKILIIDLFLPVLEDLPRLKKVSYIKSKKEFREFEFPESYMKKKYDSVLYQIVLQTINYVFSLSAPYSIVDSVVVNGRISTVDGSTGKEIEPCILTVSVNRNSFEDINLQGIDPKMWFKSAKGVSAVSLANVTPVAPIISISKEDKRFIEGYSVSEELNGDMNLATIDWQDFENLVREIFEKEFNANGGEVKITQASRDGGVDVIAFDPDPIRGGKIVIQAKRYTNVVGVSAVRDLYGTVMNEGATKGILVTTSNFGNDAYKFAQGKPITLMNGANLLYLLEKHGYKAKIDLKEAKSILRDKIF